MRLISSRNNAFALSIWSASARFALGTGAGVISGVIASTGIGAVGAAILNAAIDETEYLMIKAINGDEINKKELFATVMIGGVTAGAGIDGSKLRGVYKRSSTALKTARSSVKISMYTSKIKNVKWQVAKHIGSDVLGGALSIGCEWLDARYNRW